MLKKTLGKVFIHVYSFHWKKITCECERLLLMNADYEENFYEEIDNENIDLIEDNGMFDEYKQTVIIKLYSLFYLFKNI